MENTYLDISIGFDQTAYCNGWNFTNITGSGNRAIEYYNEPSNIENKVLSELLICGASNSNITNITIRGSETLDNNYLFAYSSNNINVTNINSSNNYRGIYISGLDNSIFSEMILQNNAGTAFRTYGITDNNTIYSV